MRWSRILGELGHEVAVDTRYDGEETDLLVALHAWHSAGSIEDYRAKHPRGPLVVALTGTDVNEYLRSEPAATIAAMNKADALVGLHDLVARSLPVEMQSRLHTIYQSVISSSRPHKPASRHFDVAVIAHLRDVKDPLRAALAARDLPQDSRIRVIHLGMAKTDDWTSQARAEMACNPRYRWRGDQPARAVRQTFARSRLMVISSLSEGGANVVGEALVAGVPILASRIDGNVGLLGENYPGYFPIGDTAELCKLLNKAESDVAFLGELQALCASKAALFEPTEEKQRWGRLLGQLMM